MFFLLLLLAIAGFTSADHPDSTPTLHFASWVSAVAFSPGGQVLACGTGDGDNKVTLWDVANRVRPSLLSTLVGYGGTVRTIVFSPNGRFLATASWDGTVMVWDVTRPCPACQDSVRIISSSAVEHAVEAVAFSPDGKYLAAGNAEGQVFLWRVTGSGQLIQLGHPFTSHTGFVRNVAFSPDGRTLAAADGDHVVILWDITAPASPVPVATLDSHSGFESAGTFSPDGKFVAASSTNGTVTIWKVTTLAKPIRVETFAPDTGDWVSGQVDAPDGKTLATANRPDAAVLWDVSDPAQARKSIVISVLTGKARFVEAVAFPPDGRWLAVASYNHTVRIWKLPR